MSKKNYNAMSTPDLEVSLSELQFELANEIDDEEYMDELESEIDDIQQILDEREEAENEIDAEIDDEKYA